MTPMPLSELQQTAEYQCLTQKQKLFCATYCEGGLTDGNYDPVAATMTAYKCKTEEIARIMSYAMMGNIRIIAVLNRHFGTTPAQAFMTVLDKALRNKTLTNAHMEVLRMKLILLGYRTAPPEVKPIPPEVVENTQDARKEKRKPRPSPKSDMVKAAENIQF